MTGALLEPIRKLSIAGAEYTLDGRLEALKDIQQHFGRDIYDIHPALATMRFDELAKVIEIGIRAGGGKPPSLDAISREIVEEIGIDEAKYLLMEWLILAISPRRDREKNLQSQKKLIESVRLASKR